MTLNSPLQKSLLLAQYDKMFQNELNPLEFSVIELLCPFWDILI